MRRLRFRESTFSKRWSSASALHASSSQGFNHHDLLPPPDCDVLSVSFVLSTPAPSTLSRSHQDSSLLLSLFLSPLTLDSALLAGCQGALCPTTFPSCCLNRSPYVLIIQVFGSQTHLGGRFSNNQSSSRAERWKMRGLGFELGGRF